MCLHPKPTFTVNTDLLERPIVYNDYCTFTDNCDYMSVENYLQLDESDLVILQLNIRGLSSKIDKLKNLLDDSFRNKRPDVLILCETWLSKSSPQVSIPGYRRYECRRSHEKGGGVAIYVIDSILSRERHDLCIDNALFEHCIAEIKVKERRLLVGFLTVTS